MYVSLSGNLFDNRKSRGFLRRVIASERRKEFVAINPFDEAAVIILVNS